MIRFVSILLPFVALGARAESAADRLLAAGVAEFTAAYSAWDGARFAAAAELFRQAGTNEPAPAATFYWLGVAHFHRMLQLQNDPAGSDNAAAAAELDAAMAALTTAVKLEARPAESHALLGTLYGMKINGGVLRAVWFGPQVQSHRSAALAAGAANPRVQYLLGMCQYHTAKKPAAWRETLATLLAAEKLFDAEAKTTAAPLEPRWGRDACLTFIGRTYEQLGQRPAAADYFRKALVLHPADHLASAGLQRVTENK